MMTDADWKQVEAARAAEAAQKVADAAVRRAQHLARIAEAQAEAQVYRAERRRLKAEAKALEKATGIRDVSKIVAAPPEQAQAFREYILSYDPQDAFGEPPVLRKLAA